MSSGHMEKERLRWPSLTVRQSNHQDEGPSYLFDTLPIFPESGLEEHQLLMENFLVTQSLGSVHEGLKNALYVGGRVM